MKSSKRNRALLYAGILDNPYIPHTPKPKQKCFLLDQRTEGLYGGAGGGGKTDALLMGALMYADVPGYSALLLRRTYPDLQQPGGLIPRSKEWLMGTQAEWREQHKQWTFPNGASLLFGHCQTQNDIYQYQGGEYHYIGFDELTQFTRSQYSYLFSRLRKPEGCPTPLRMRAATNPGGEGHDWVRERFILPSLEEMDTAHRYFVPARLADNPYIDQAAYTHSLDRLDPVTRAQILFGDWDVAMAGEHYRREWFPIREHPPSCKRRLRYWDLAATEATRGRDPDYTVGLLLGEAGPAEYCVLDVVRGRWRPGDLDKIVLQTAIADGPSTIIRMEQEPGASGKIAIEHYKNILSGYDYRAHPATRDKYERARPVESLASQGGISIIRASWTSTLINELVSFGSGAHDDQEDALVGAWECYQHRRGIIMPEAW